MYIKCILTLLPFLIGVFIHYYSRKAPRLPLIFGAICSGLIFVATIYIDKRTAKNEYQCFVSCEYKKCINIIQSVPNYESILKGFYLTPSSYCSTLADLQYYFSNPEIRCHNVKGRCLDLKLLIEYSDIQYNYEEYIKIEPSKE